MPKRYLRLEEAADKLEAQGLATGRDYHALSTDDKLLLNTVMGQTMWRQSPSAANAGRSRSYSFWLAVRRYWQAGGGPRRRRATSTNVVRGPTEPTTNPQKAGSGSNQRRAAPATTITLRDRISGNRVHLTLRNGVVVGAMGSDPDRYIGLTETAARRRARYAQR